MKKWLAASAVLTAGVVVWTKASARAGAALEEVFSDGTFQITGVTVSRRGRLFVNYPRWSDSYLNAVVEVLPNGTTRPYPDEVWNRWDRKPASAGEHFVCVQSLVADESDSLWILDPAAPMLTSPVPGGAKLVQVNLGTNRVGRVYPFGPDVARADSYLNDVRVDLRTRTAYLTDSGAGGIVVLDLTSGRARRLLDGHPSVMAEPGVSIAIEGKPVVDAQGQPPQFNSDGIALSNDGAWLYYQPITATALYRVPTTLLRDPDASPAAVAQGVERYATTFPVDGLWIDAKDRVYLSDICHTAIARVRPDRTIERLAVDRRLQWPDTFSQGPDGSIYVTASHINESPAYNRGKSVRRQPYSVFRFRPAD